MTLVALGRVVGPHGVRGELRVKLYNMESDLFWDRERFSLRRGEHIEQAEVESSRPHKAGALVALTRCTTREEADALRGAELCVPREELPDLDDGEYYLVDLIGRTVVSVTGDEMGQVTGVINYPTSDALEVAGPSGKLEIPVQARYVAEVRDGSVVVDHLDELTGDGGP